MPKKAMTTETEADILDSFTFDQAAETAGVAEDEEDEGIPVEETAPEEEDTDEVPEAPAEAGKADGKPVDYEKRFKDTQASYTREREARLALERRIAELEAAQAAPKDAAPAEDGEDEVLTGFQERFEDDPKAAIAWALRQLRGKVGAEVETVRTELARRELSRQEEDARAKYKDYDAVVTDFLVPKIQADPGMRAHWQKEGGTAEAAYRLGRNLMEYEEFQRDPSAYRTRIKDELKAELSAGDDTPKTLTSVSSGKPPKAKAATDYGGDVLGEVLAGIR